MKESTQPAPHILVSEVCRVWTLEQNLRAVMSASPYPEYGRQSAITSPIDMSMKSLKELSLSIDWTQIRREISLDVPLNSSLVCSEIQGKRGCFDRQEELGAPRF